MAKYEIEIGGKKLIIEIGKLANQANGSCTVQYGNTVVLATVVMSSTIREGVNFLPLLVDYEERFYAAGKIKGSRFIKREGRASDEAITTARLVDRSLRPLFDERIRNDIQIVITVLSFDQENDPDIPSLIASIIALAISDIPFEANLAGLRVGRTKEELVLNPIYKTREKCDLDLVVVANDNKVVMLEMGGKEVKEKDVLKVIDFALKHLFEIQKLIEDIKIKHGKEKNLRIIEKIKEEEKKEKDLKEMVEKFLSSSKDILFKEKIKTKDGRKEAVKKIKEELEKYLEDQGIGKEKREKALSFLNEIISQEVSMAILKKEQRIDGRKLDEIREITCEISLLPQTHGSALFIRGETQVLSTVTLGAPSEEQYLDTMEEKGKKRFMEHYNFPPFSVGEISPLRGPGRREIGHSMLAEKSLLPVLPEKEEFPYTIRVVSEVLSSNGSSSMASVCASSLALMDAGVPIKKAVVGIAMGLVSENEKFKVIIDLQDLEDVKGGMDFKIAGTKDGITAIQLDVKNQGLKKEMIEETLEKALKARKEILEKMNKVISFSRLELSPLAPRVTTLQISQEKIREVIGPGGKVINEIIAQTGVIIDIEPSGLTTVTSNNKEAMEKAIDWIKNLTREVKVGEIFQGKVVRILDFGAFVEILPNQDGLVHISELAPFRVREVEDIVKIGDIIPVKVIKIDEQGRINLSLKAVKKDYNKEI